MALSLFNTLDSINTPYSVNANGKVRRPPQFEIANCDFNYAREIASLGYSLVLVIRRKGSYNPDDAPRLGEGHHRACDHKGTEFKPDLV
jgi:hypothetical protein